MQETVVENPYGLGALIAQGDIVARSTLVILLIMSLLTWFIMITKFFDQRRLRLQADRGGEGVLGLHQPDRCLGKLKGDSNPVPRARRDRQAGVSNTTRSTRPGSAGAIGTSEWITESLQRTADTVISRMQADLPVLASVGSTAPFVGLFGTVVGHLPRADRHQPRRSGLHRQGGGSRRRGPDHDGHRLGGRRAGGAGLQRAAAPQ